MLDLNPPFYIYEPPLLMFGGVEINPPYNGSDTIKEMSTVLRSVERSIYQAYDIYLRVYAPSNAFISTRISPLTATIDKKCKDFLIGSFPKGNRELAYTLLKRLMLVNKEVGLFYHEKGFYAIQKLKENFDTLETESLIKSIKAAILTLTHNRFRITSNISDKVLNVNAEIMQPDISYLV